MSSQAVIYTRISLDKSGEGLGVERQEKECRDLCERMGWDVQEVFSDNSISAMKSKVRPAFEQLLSSDPERIVMWSVDRLVRKVEDLSRLIELDVPVHSVAAGPMDLSTASGRLNAALLTSVATFESEIKAERQRSMHRQRATQGRPFWNRRPFGLELPDERGVVVEREEEAEALRKVYSDFLAGVPLAALARGLNDKGLFTAQGNPWGSRTLGQALRNARNAGILVYRGREIGPGNWPAIVSEDVYRAAVAILDSRLRGTSKAGPRRNLLTGWAHCALCKKTLRAGQRSNKDGSLYRYYYCADSGHLAIDREYLEALVLRKAVGSLTAAEARGWTDSQGATVDVAALRAEESAVSERIASLGEAYAAGLIDLAALTRGTEVGRRRLDELRSQIASGADPAAELVDVEAIYEAAELMETDRLRALLQRVVAKIEVRPRGKGNRNLEGAVSVTDLRDEAL